MSFFDDDDDAVDAEPRRPVRSDAPSRPRGGSGSGTGSGGGPPRTRSTPPRRASDPAVERRRWVAGGVLVIVIILVVLLISSCQARNTKNSLEDYNNSVSSLITRSDDVGAQVFRALATGGSGSTVAQSLATPLQNARQQLQDARDLGVPGQMAAAQRNVVLAMQMRADGISQIADAVSGISAQPDAAVKQIALGTARFYASDVTYIDYAAQEIARALHGDNISVGVGGSAINDGQFLPSIDWLVPSYIANKLGTTYTGGSGSGSGSGAGAGQDAGQKCQSGQTCVHGDILNAVAVGSNQMSTSVTNTVTGSPAPTFTLSVENGGGYDEFDVGCSVSVEGGPSGKGSISETTPGNTSTCSVTLNKAVPAGTYSVTATVAGVPGETNLSDNSETFSVQFQ